MSEESRRGPSVSMPDFSQVDPSILGISLPPLPTAPRDPSNLYPEEWSNKTWGQQMIYHTGVAYLVGTTVGGVWGLFQGVSKAKKFSSNRTLVMNSIINAVSKRSSMTGNSMGVLVMMFSCYKSLISYYSYREQFWHPVAAGALAGFTFKCTSSLREGIKFGGLGVGASVLYYVAKTKGSSLFQRMPKMQF